MGTYFSADGNTAYVTCCVCGTACDDAMLFWFDEEDGELSGWPQAYEWSFWQRLKQAWRFIRHGQHWPCGVSVAWHGRTDRDDVRQLGEWLIEKSGRVGETLADRVRVPQTPDTGIGAIIGKWPGDETDEEIAETLDETTGGTT